MIMNSCFFVFGFGFFTKSVIAIGVREPEPNILPPSFRLNSPLVRWFPRKIKNLNRLKILFPMLFENHLYYYHLAKPHLKQKQ